MHEPTPRCPLCNHKEPRHDPLCRRALVTERGVPQTSAERYATLAIEGDVCGPFTPPEGHFGRGPIMDHVDALRAEQERERWNPDAIRPPDWTPNEQFEYQQSGKWPRYQDRPAAPQEPRQTLPTDAAARKDRPLATGVLDYFPAALIAVASLSRIGNEQHNPGQPLHWARGKSGDEADALLRHLVDRGTVDTDGVRHSVKVAWRALALLQKELEDAGEAPLSRGSREPE